MCVAEIEKQKDCIPMSGQTLSFLHTADGAIQVDFRWVSNVLWTFMGKHISDVYTTIGVQWLAVPRMVSSYGERML